MGELVLIQDLILVLFTAFFGGIVAKKLRLPLLVGYLLGGVLLGGFSTHLFQSQSHMRNIAEIGVALLLFTLGLEFTLTKLKSLGEVIVLGSLVQILLTVLVTVFIFPLLGLDFYSSLFLGVVFSLSSTALAMKTLSDKGELDTLHGEMATGWLFMQDFYTLPIIIILPTIGILLKGESIGGLTLVSMFKNIAFAFAIPAIVLALGKRIVPSIFEKIADFNSRELLIICTIAFCLLFAYAFSLMGISSAIGAFIAGILLASSSAHHSIFSEIRPLRDLFAVIFFVSLGFMVNTGFLYTHWPLIAGMTALVIVLKFFISTLLVLFAGYHTKTATLVGFSLISVGEFAFILALIGISAHLINEYVYMLILSVSFLTLVVSMPLLTAGNSIYYSLKSYLKKYIPSAGTLLAKFDHEEINSIDDALSNHVVVLGHGRIGKYICHVLETSHIPFVVIDYNHHLVKILRQLGTPIIYGDPVEIDVLNFAQVKNAKVMIIAYTDRQTQEIVVANTVSLNPKIKIICRTHHEEDQKKLLDLGVYRVVQPEFEAALSMTREMLSLFKNDLLEIEEKLQNLRYEHAL